MSIATTILRARDTESGAANRMLALGAMALAAAVFAIDTFTDIESAIAVLYVVVMLLASQAVTRKGLWAVTALCGLLAILSYVMTHARDADLQSALRLLVALSALGVTTVLLAKTEAARLALVSTNAALEVSEERYRSIFARAPVALWERDYSKLHAMLMDLKSRGLRDVRDHARENPGFTERCIDMITVVASNEAGKEMLGYDASATGALRNTIAVGAEKFLDVLQAILDDRRVFEDRVTLRTASGEDKLVLLSISFPEDPHAFDRVVVSMVDVTQRELALKALAEAKAELTKAAKAATVGAMSASLAHELNQPLGAIVVNAQTLLRWLDRDPPDLAAARRSAERMARDSRRASEIIQNTRSLLTQKDGKIESFDLDVLLDETLALLEHDLERCGTRVSVERQPTPPLRAVRIELQQVLINLLNNAIQAMGEVAVEDRLIILRKEIGDDGAIRLTVRDSGPGIADDIRDKLFSPFFTTKATGMGMGLSICRTTIEARGGSLTAENHPLGGAVFSISMPLDVEVENA